MQEDRSNPLETRYKHALPVKHHLLIDIWQLRRDAYAIGSRKHHPCGLFAVLERVRRLAYRLEPSSHWNVHNVVNIAFLEPAPKGADPFNPMQPRMTPSTMSDTRTKTAATMLGGGESLLNAYAHLVVPDVSSPSIWFVEKALTRHMINGNVHRIWKA